MSTKLQRAYRNLNTSTVKQISKAFEDDPTADIQHVLSKVSDSYTLLRIGIEERELRRKRRTDSIQQEVNEPPLKTNKPSFLEKLSPSLSLDPPCSLPCTIIHALSPVVCEILNITTHTAISEVPNLSTIIIRCVSSGVTLWEGPKASNSRAVIQIGDHIVVKIARNLDQDEHNTLKYLEEHLPQLPTPRALGFVTIGPTGFMFMTKIPGRTLESRWPTLPPAAKSRIQRILDENLRALRGLELVPGVTPLGSPTASTSGVIGRHNGHVCKDVRRDAGRILSLSAEMTIYTEGQFNDALMESPPTSSRAASGYKGWLRAMLRNDHRMVFTHGDFHPRNIMVCDSDSDSRLDSAGAGEGEGDGGGSGDCMVELSGIIDWEAGGFYPEYWEYSKAMNTRSVRDTSDWWEFLPECILGYDRDVVLDRVIGSTVVY